MLSTELRHLRALALAIRRSDAASTSPTRVRRQSTSFQTVPSTNDGPTTQVPDAGTTQVPDAGAGQTQPQSQSQSQSQPLAVTQIIAVTVSVCLLVALIGLFAWWLLRRRRSNRSPSPGDDEELKATYWPAEPPTPRRSTFGRMMRRLSRMPNTRAEAANGNNNNTVPSRGTTTAPTYAKDDAPVQLGMDGTQGGDTYELRRWGTAQQHHHQPIPNYTPSSSPMRGETHAERSSRNVESVANYLPLGVREPSPDTTPSSSNFASAMPSPSPWTPFGDSTTPTFDRSRPIGVGRSDTVPRSDHKSTTPLAPANPHLSTLNRSASSSYRSLTRSASSSRAANSSADVMIPRPPPVQRTPIDDSVQFVCLGPLPDNIPRPNQRPLPPPIPLRTNGNRVDDLTRVVPEAPPSYEESFQELSINTFDTLGSNFTVEEEARCRAAMLQPSPTTGCIGSDDDFVHVPEPREARAPAPERSQAIGRIQVGDDFVHIPQIPQNSRLARETSSIGHIAGDDDLVHVPQPATHRFSWE